MQFEESYVHCLPNLICMQKQDIPVPQTSKSEGLLVGGGSSFLFCIKHNQNSNNQNLITYKTPLY